MHPPVGCSPGIGLSVKIPIFAISKCNYGGDCEGSQGLVGVSPTFHAKV